MNIKKLQFPVFIICLLFVNPVSSQRTYQLGVLPAVNLNNKFKNDWSFNTKIESRQRLQSGDFSGGADKEYQYVLTDISLIAGRKVGLNSRIGGGYLIRIAEGEQMHRFIQQYIIVQKKSGYRLAHRFLTDQTFSEKEAPVFRLRYRITSEIPLNGESVDPTEFYLKLNNEYVNSVQEADYDLEIRLVPLLGYGISDDHKIELGLDYRINSFVSSSTQHSFWVSLNWFVEIGK